MIESIFQSGLQGVQTGLQQMQIEAHEIATSVVDRNSSGLSENLINLKIAKSQVFSSLAVIEVADDILGTLLNEFA